MEGHSPTGKIFSFSSAYLSTCLNGLVMQFVILWFLVLRTQNHGMQQILLAHK